MSPEVSDLLKRALALSVDERAALANTQLDSLEGTDESVQEAWDQEVARRIEDLRAGKTQQVSKTAEPSYLQALTPTERKDYEALKADLEKQRKVDPADFKKLQAKMTLQSQIILGRFGYGTPFHWGVG
jgi:putative addiction module component (TIGR02574 family)